MVAINFTHIFMSGGFVGQHHINSTYLFDSKAGWIKMPDMNVNRDDHACALVDNRTVMVVGGDGYRARSTTELFDLEKRNWRFGPSLPMSSREAKMVTVDGQTYHIGGTKTDSLKIYRLDQDGDTGWKWTEINTMLYKNKREFDATFLWINDDCTV